MFSKSLNWFDVVQDLRNEDLSLRPKRSVGKQSQDFCVREACPIGHILRYRYPTDMLRKRNDAVTLLLRKSYCKYWYFSSEY